MQGLQENRQQLLNDLDRLRHDREALQEENVHLRVECERLSGEAVEQQCRLAGSGDAEADASRDWRISSDNQLKQTGTSPVSVVTEGFVLPHDVEQLQERIVELERANRILSSRQQHVSHSPDATVSGSDQDIGEGVFIDEKLPLARTTESPSLVFDSATDRAFLSCSHEDAEISPVPSPDIAETHSPAYERLKAEFIAYKQKAHRDYTKLKARLASTVREYTELKSSCTFGASPSPSPVLRSPVSPVADVLILQSNLNEQLSSADRKHSTSGRHCEHKEVQTDISRDIDTPESSVDRQTVDVIQGSQTGSREMDSTASTADRCKSLEMELSVLRLQYSDLMQQNASLTELSGCLQGDAENQEWSSIREIEGAVATTDGFTTADTSDATDGNYRNLLAENRRLRQQRKLDRSEYQEKLQRMEERCVQENASLRQLLDGIDAGSEHSAEVGDGDSSSCRHCAKLAEKCRLLETSVELSSLSAERRLQEAEESRSIAAHLQSRLDQLSADDRSMVSDMHAGSANCLFSYVVGDHVITNMSVADKQRIVCDDFNDAKTVSSIDRSALPVSAVHCDLVKQLCQSRDDDVDFEVAEIFESKHEGSVRNIVNSDSKLCKSVDNLTDGDIKTSHSFEYSPEFNDTVSIQAQCESSPFHNSCQSAVTETHLAECETELTETFPDLSGQQHLVTEPLSVIQQESFQPFASIETAGVEHQPQEAASLSDKKMTKCVGQEEETTRETKSCSVDCEKHEEAYVEREDLVKSANPGVTSSAVMLENVARLVSQNEEILRRNRAWTDKLKREYEVAASELKTMKDKYETIVCEKEKVREHLLLAHLDIKAGGYSDMKQSVAGEKATARKTQVTSLPRRRQSDDISARSLVNVPCREVAEMKTQYDVLLNEKNELCRKFEVERLELLKKLEENDSSLTSDPKMSRVQDADVNNKVELYEIPPQLIGESSWCHAAPADNDNLWKEHSTARLNASFDDSVGRPIAESLTCDPVQSSVTAWSPGRREKLHAVDAAKPLGQSLESDRTTSAAAPATFSEVALSSSGFETASQSDIADEHMQKSSVGLLCQDEVSSTGTESSRNSTIIHKSDVEVADESQCIKVHSTYTNLPAIVADVSAKPSSNVDVELELLRLEKRELCASLEKEEQKSAELQCQQSELAIRMNLLEVQSSELEEQLSSAKIQLQVVLEEKKELCQQCEELAAQLEASRVTQTGSVTVTECQTLVQDISTSASTISDDAADSLVCEDVTNNDADSLFPVQLDSRQSDLLILELKAALECSSAEKLALQEKLEHCQEECHRLIQSTDQLHEQLDSTAKSSEDALHAAAIEVQELTSANSALEITNLSLTNELKALKSHCSSLQDDSKRLSEAAGSLQLELESTSHAKEFLSQHSDELHSQVESMQQQIACLEQENADFRTTLQRVNEKNECLSVEIADARRDCELLSIEKKKLSEENSVAESANCMLEEQYTELVERLQQLEFTETETRRQHSTELRNVQLALQQEQKDSSVLLEEVEALKLAAELNSLKLHDSLKQNEQQLEQLINAETAIRDLEENLCGKQNEVLSITDLHTATLSAVDEVTSLSVSLQTENETISAALSELKAEKDQLLTESETKAEALETELLRKTADISSLLEKAGHMEAANEQLTNELHTVNTALQEIQHQLEEEKVYHEKQMNAFKVQLAEERVSAKTVCDSHVAELEEITLKCNSIELQLSAMKTENKYVRHELERAREDVGKQQELVNTVSNEYQQYKHDAETQLADIKSVRDGLADSLCECQQEKEKAEDKLDLLASDFECCKCEMAALTAEIDNFKQCNDDLKLRVAQTQKSEENLAGELKQVRDEHARSCASHRSEIDEQKRMVLRAGEERDELRRTHEQSCQLIDETIAKYTEVEAQLGHLRQTNNMLMTDLHKTNQRCEVLSSENRQLLSEHQQLVDSLSSKNAETGRLAAEHKAAEAKVVELSLEIESLREQLTEVVSKEAALQEEARELKCTNSQLKLELEDSQQLSQKLSDDCKHVEEIESELGELKSAHMTLLNQEKILTEEIRLLTARRDELTATLQSESQTHQLECQDLKSQIAEMEEVLCAAQRDTLSLQVQKHDVEKQCKCMNDCIANCILEVLRDVTADDMEIETESAVHKEISESDVVEQVTWLQVQICRKNDKLQSFQDELTACRKHISSQQSSHLSDKEMIQKLEHECKQLKDDLTSSSRQHDEASKQHAAAVSELLHQLDEQKHENERLLEDHRIISDLHSSSQQNVLILTEEIATLKSTLQQLEVMSAEKESTWKVRDSEFNSLVENYNVAVTEKSALETENQLISGQMETLQKEQVDLAAQLKMSCSSNSALEEKLSQAAADLQLSFQECDAHRRKILELEENLSKEDSEKKKFGDMLQKYKALINEISGVVSSVSQKCQIDYQDVNDADEVNTSHTEYADGVFNQYSHVLPSLDLISSCYERMAEEQNQQKEKFDALVAECDILRAQASVDLSVDVDMQELQDEVARLFQGKTDLENEVMRLHAENDEAKDAHDHREVEIAAERASWEQKSADLHHLLDMASQSKEALETELLCERNEFERNLAAARSENLLRAGRSAEEQRKIIEQLSDAESQLAGLRDRLRASQDERDLLQLRLAYVTRECTVKEQHLDDLRAQVAAQHAHIEEAMKEHRDTIQLLVELRLEQQLGRREQRGEFSRLEEEMLRLESHIESCSSWVGTPQTMSLVNAPVSPQPPSVHSLPPNAASETVKEPAVGSGPDHEQTLRPSPDDLAYKALETKHFQLIQELSELKQQLLGLQEANSCLTNDNLMLKQHIESKTVPPVSSLSTSASLCNIQEHKLSLDFSRGPYRVQSCEQFSSVGSTTSLASFDQRAVGLNVPVEMVSLQAKLVRLQKAYQELADENTELRTSLLAKQDELMKQMELVREKQKKRSFRFGSSSSENVAAMTEVSGQQIQLLQKERDELRCRLDAARLKEEDAAKLSDRVEQLEDALSKERRKFHELFQEKESIEIQLLRERLTVEKHVREFQHLQGLVSKKDRLEQQLRQTSSALNPNSASSAGTRQLLQDKKSQLVVEIRRKILYRDVALQVGDGNIKFVRRTQVMSVDPVMKRPPPVAAERSLRLDCGCITELGTMRMRAGCRYHQAVERLRRELKAQDAAARKAHLGKHTDIH